MSHGIGLLISGTAGIAVLFLTLTMFVLFLGSAHWSSPVSSIPGLTSLILGVVTFRRYRLVLAIAGTANEEVTCLLRARSQGEPRGLAVTHGQSTAGPAGQRIARSATKIMPSLSRR
jgi:hypothetical protein